jgi:hypothetical protein
MIKRADLSRPYVRIEPNTDPRRAIDFLYRNPIEGASRRYGKAATAGDGLVSDKQHADEVRLQQPQFREDKHGPHYCPSTPKSWVHGGNATSRPGFDHSPKRGSERR